MNLKLKILAYIIIFIGALNYGLLSLNFNLIELIFGKYFSKAIYLIITISALYLMFDRNTYLPFLGKTAFPCGLLSEKYPNNANYKVNVITKPNSLVLYWAANPGHDNRNYKEAYDLYKNSGVAISNNNGIATLRVVKPSGYNVPFNKIKSHVHYRTCISPGMLGEVKTIYT